MTGLASLPGSGTTPLERRSIDLGRLVHTTWDVVIVGGGVVGSGALLDAASRGLTAALIEKDDIAAGTSSRSSRLIHGGLRYLEQIHLPLVREALAERRRLLRNAPHLVALEPQLFPVYGLPFIHKAFYDAGLTLYDILGARHDGGWHRRLDVKGATAIWPSLRRQGLRGGLLYHDGVEDDARFALAVLRTALASDASPIAVTRVRATGLTSGAPSERLRTLHAHDVAGDVDIDIRARAIVDATGVWAAEAEHPFASPSMRLRPSRGAHLVVPRERIPGTTGLTIRVPGKVVFFIPWPDHWLIGTTDAPYDGPPDRVSASAGEVDELLATVNATLDVDLTRDDIVGTYAGLRPLIAPSGGSTVKASREHRITAEANGVVRVAGGKYTTYRVMARDVIDAALGSAAASERPSTTADMPVIGAADEVTREGIARALDEGHPAIPAAHPEAASRLAQRHGTEAPAVAALGERFDLLRPLVAGRPFLEAEVVWAVHNELALSVDDVLSRRLRLSPELGEARAAAADRVASIMARELGWDEGECERQRDAYLDSANREYAVPGRV
ncbi:MAG TPA: glycerol-3-phosphate dehydrogenase/oxidase [Candidatus Limnocylindrales bacterium]|nr:glycerol-3-phosphate dehydrogenase/oxidase [Candidatus Limnocylindrales bacterium]